MKYEIQNSHLRRDPIAISMEYVGEINASIQGVTQLRRNIPMVDSGPHD